MSWLGKFKVQFRAFFVNIKTTLAGVVAVVLVLSSELDALPESWREPMRVSAVIATAIGAVFARDDTKTSEETLSKGK